MQQEFNLPPAARRTDPATSHEAEAKVNRSGRRANQTVVAAKMVTHHPGRTCGELAQIGPLTERQLSRRLSDAERTSLIVAGDPRRCRASGAPARTWWPA